MADDSNFFERIMELGIGMSMARQMPDMFSQCMGPSQQATPPQIPVETQYYLVVDNAQAGPFKESELQLMAKNNLSRPETLVWKAGMAKWTPASQVPEINKMLLLAKL